MTLLDVQGARIAYGGVVAVHGANIRVPEGAIVAVLGPNGAGKSSLVRGIAGLVPLAAGEIAFRGQAIRGADAARIVRLGLAVVPEGRRVFPRLSVLENLLVGGYTRSERERRTTLESVYATFPRLAERKQQMAGSLSGGEQQMLAIGRALMSHPALIVMDEPSLGLSPIATREVGRAIQELRAGGRSVLLVEQNSQLALRLADYAYIFERGVMVQEGDASVLREHDYVRNAYLGL